MEYKTNVNGAWREVFSQLLTVLVVKSEAPSEIKLCKDDLELLRCYRQDIADSLVSMRSYRFSRSFFDLSCHVLTRDIDRFQHCLKERQFRLALQSTCK